MKNGYDFDPMNSIHYINIIDFIKLKKLKIFKKSKFSIKLIMTLYSLKNDFFDNKKSYNRNKY